MKNLIESMALDKSCWALVETASDGTIYMGKPSTEDAKEDESVWYIKRIEKSHTEEGDIIETKIASPAWGCKWTERKTEGISWKYF